MLWQYLTDTSVSPLRKELVDIPDPYCAQLQTGFAENSVFLQVYLPSPTHLTTLITAISLHPPTTTNLFSQYLKFQNAPSDKLALLKDKVFEVLQNVHKGGIDMHRLTSVIQRLRLRVHNTPLQSKLADSPSSIYHK